MHVLHEKRPAGLSLVRVSGVAATVTVVVGTSGAKREPDGNRDLKNDSKSTQNTNCPNSPLDAPAGAKRCAVKALSVASRSVAYKPEGASRGGRRRKSALPLCVPRLVLFVLHPARSRTPPVRLRDAAAYQQPAEAQLVGVAARRVEVGKELLADCPW